jgi:Gpi18-like mannosyltransferase
MISLLRRLKTHLIDPSLHEQRKWDLLVIGFYAFLMFFIPSQSFDWDSYVRWAEHIRLIGLENIYQYWAVNYMPINIFAIHLWQLFCESQGYVLNQWFHLLKIYPMLFDAATVLLLFRFAKRWKASLLTVAVLFLPNLAFQYNSFIWGQFDTIYTFFILLSLYCILKKQPLAAFLAFFLALNGKIQAIIFFPALVSFAWLYIYQGTKDAILRAGKTVGLGLVIAVIAQYVLLAPFRGTPPLMILDLIVSRSASLSTWITLNANNFWILIGVPSMALEDTTTWIAGQTYHTWGLWMFLASTVLTFLPLLISFGADIPALAGVLRKLKLSVVPVREWAVGRVIQLMALVCYLQAMSFFYFLTQMHERYSHPALAFAGLFALFSRRKAIFVLTCAAYLLNLEMVAQNWHQTFALDQISWIGQFSAALFLIALLLALRSLFGLYLGDIQQKRR